MDKNVHHMKHKHLFKTLAIPKHTQMEARSDETPNNLPKTLQQDENLSQEFKNQMSTLPMDEGWLSTISVYQYQGFWFEPRLLQGILTCQKHFEANDKDIILVTYPKSGTTWLKALTFALLNRNKYPPTQENNPLLVTNPHILVPFLPDLFYDEDFIIPNPSQYPSPRLLSTHVPYVLLPKSVKESDCKIVYLCRDPKDIFISMFEFIRKNTPETSSGSRSLDECFELFCRGRNSNGPFWDHVLEYWKESLEKSEKVMFLRYEQMKLHPTLILKELAEFIGCPFSQQELDNGMLDDILNLCSFDNLRNLEVNQTGTVSTKMGYEIQKKSFFRCGKIGDSKNFLTPEMIKKINTITEKKLAQHGLRF